MRMRVEVREEIEIRHDDECGLNDADDDDDDDVSLYCYCCCRKCLTSFDYYL